MHPDHRDGVLDLLALYCELIDEYEIDATAALFTADCVVDFGPGRGGVLHGRAAVRDRLASGQAGFRRTHHQLGQSRLCPDRGGDRVEAVTYATASHELADGSRWRVGLRYVDVVVRRETPPELPERASTDWAIAQRALVATLVEDGPPEGWTWVPRRRPEIP
jgi:hypothetical protein